ncbi:hypothetical protein BACCIP111895_03221 [Neobacillus rhizosphaerae]|uniref:N-acetyltransferase domain-containing protein n=1 Tax=Neobacillus rhizosphaerae TaxID=2880965 RepID=A0ABM9ETR0_9BACI|nr:GNAT family N-acetyltransferase [Neobacillus rhizosphaerae]CAH2716037.1 hypothetical protein BACCIP111895_03221 [Neobacillus rhizosphaerae]
MDRSFISNEITCLEFYHSEIRPQLKHYFLSDEQLQYTAHPLDAIVACENDTDRFPVMILYDEKPAGFFVLHGWEGVKEYTDNKKALLLRAYSVNSSFQRKGIAQRSLQLLPDFVNKHFPEINEVILTVNQQNTLAQHVYKKGGFIDKGARAMGSKGLLFIYHLNL